tara:strand:- start:768 stop:1505 length:738 start_codon:yes stop_codon:yes gene_type:complete
MRRSHELKSLILKQKLAIEKLAKLHELNILKIVDKVKKYISSISDNSIDDIYVNFSETNVEIGLNDLRFGTSASLLPPSYLRNNWELNHGSVGGVDKDSGYLDKIILLGIIATEFKNDGKLFKILETGLGLFKSHRKSIKETKHDEFVDELKYIESEAKRKKTEFIHNSFIKNGGIENDKGANIYVKKTSRWSSYVKKIKFNKVTEKTITAEYIFSDGSWVKYRGDKGFVLRNCRTIYKKNYDIV